MTAKKQRTPHSRSTFAKVDTAAEPVSLEKLGVSRFDFKDPYHFALTLSWGEFFVVLIGVYLGINTLFALLYFVAPGSIANLTPDSPIDAFFFSVETLATVGYGFMAPATRYGHLVATVEIFVGMIFTATMTGLFFVRFSKPKAKILFAARPVITHRGPHPVLMIRVGNGRANALSDAQARVTAFIVGKGPDGHNFRRALDLKLQRADLPFFPMTWTLIHELDATSPLHGLTVESAATGGLRMLLSIEARDPSLGAQVYAARGYRAEHIAFGMRYADAITWDGDNNTVADMRKIGEIEAED